MSEKLVRETPVEFFREQLGKAMENQRVSISAFTEFYLVNLLARCVRGDPLPRREPGYDETPLALLYVRAVQASRSERPHLLRALGDMALFISGFFADSLSRHPVDRGYYGTLGGHAYARLSEEGSPLGLGSDVFGDLARRFMQFADLFSEVSEASRLTNDASVLRLYERWLQTGSSRAAALLADRGICPVAPVEGPAQ